MRDAPRNCTSPPPRHHSLTRSLTRVTRPKSRGRSVARRLFLNNRPRPQPPPNPHHHHDAHPPSPRGVLLLLLLEYLLLLAGRSQLSLSKHGFAVTRPSLSKPPPFLSLSLSPRVPRPLSGLNATTDKTRHILRQTPTPTPTDTMSALLSYLVKFLVGYFALTVFFYALSLAVPRAGFVARVLAAYISLVACALLGAAASAALTLAGHQQISQWVTARSFKYLMYLTTGVVFEVDDPRDVLGTTRPAVFIGNHQTELDVLMLGAMFPKYCSVTAKSDLKHMPFLGWFMRLSGSIFIDRKNSKDAREAMQGAAQEIRAKRQSVYMFPEGTRSYTKEPALLPFKKGAFHLAVQAGVPIVPCVVANYSHVLYLKSLIFNSGRIPIKGTSPAPPFLLSILLT